MGRVEPLSKGILTVGRKFSDNEIRRELESDGRTFTDWSADEGLAYYRDSDGNEFVVMDDDDQHAAAVIRYLLRNGRRREKLSDPTV